MRTIISTVSILVLLVGFSLGASKSETNETPSKVSELRAKAEQGDATAQTELGLCYVHGEGVAKDPVEAVKWFRTAVEQGDASAQSSLGNCYINGLGVAKDPVEAVKWYRKAAEQGNAGAQYNLGFCYYLGEGVTRDFMQAYLWLSLSLAQGIERSRDIIQQLEEKLTPSQIAEAQRMTENLKRKPTSEILLNLP